MKTVYRVRGWLEQTYSLHIEEFYWHYSDAKNRRVELARTICPKYALVKIDEILVQ